MCDLGNDLFRALYMTFMVVSDFTLVDNAGVLTEASASPATSEHARRSTDELEFCINGAIQIIRLYMYAASRNCPSEPILDDSRYSDCSFLLCKL